MDYRHAKGSCIFLFAAKDMPSLPPGVAGMIVVDGAPLSHAMIPLLGSGIPTVIISAEQAALLTDGMELTVDGHSGIIYPGLADTEQHQNERLAPHPSVTVDGVHIHLRVSARNIEAAHKAVEYEAEAVGLVRSEFLEPADGRIPDTAFFCQAFAALCDAAAPLSVTIRLTDIGADKRPSWLPAMDDVGAPLSLQGVRLFEREPVHSVYRAQLTAISDLHKRYELRVLLPYVSSYEELRHWVTDLRRNLPADVAIGAMAETPASVLQLNDWLELIDFAGIGCNDLMQCLFGADRDRPELRTYLDPHAPALYRFLQQAADAARAHLNKIQLCGVLAQLPGILPILMGLGYRVFSVEAAMLSELRRTISSTNLKEAEVLATQVCAARDAGEVRRLLGAVARSTPATLRLERASL